MNPIIVLKDGLDLIDCQLSHMQILFRSTSVEKDSWSNTDLLFEQVIFLEICPRLYGGVEIYEGSEEERKYISSKLQDDVLLEEVDMVYVIRNGNKKYFVGSLKMKIAKNQLLRSDSSIPEV